MGVWVFAEGRRKQNTCMSVCITSDHPSPPRCPRWPGHHRLCQASAAASSWFPRRFLQSAPEGRGENRAAPHRSFRGASAQPASPHSAPTSPAPLHSVTLPPARCTYTSLASLLFLERIRRAPTSGPLHRLFLLPDITFQMSLWLIPSIPSLKFVAHVTMTPRTHPGHPLPASLVHVAPTTFGHTT